MYFNLLFFSFSSKLSQEEIERRRVRRERNKLAAAKCRNRRRELTDTLQNVSEHCTNVTAFMLEIHGVGLRQAWENLHVCLSLFLLSPGVGD